MNEKLINFNRKEITLDRLKSKLSYPFDHKDLRELEKIIDYYEGENKQLKEILNQLEDWLKSDEVAILNIPTIEVILKKIKLLKGESNE